jgi:hypothetical protein
LWTKLRQSRFVEPTLDQTPSITAVLACRSASWRSKIRTPAASSSS